MTRSLFYFETNPFWKVPTHPTVKHRTTPYRTTIVEVLLSNKRIEFFIATLIFLCFNLVIIYFSGSRVQVWRRRNWWWSILCVSNPKYSRFKLDYIETRLKMIESFQFLSWIWKKGWKGFEHDMLCGYIAPYCTKFTSLSSTGFYFMLTALLKLKPNLLPLVSQKISIKNNKIENRFQNQ